MDIVVARMGAKAHGEAALASRLHERRAPRCLGLVVEAAVPGRELEGAGELRGGALDSDARRLRVYARRHRESCGYGRSQLKKTGPHMGRYCRQAAATFPTTPRWPDWTSDPTGMAGAG